MLSCINEGDALNDHDAMDVKGVERWLFSIYSDNGTKTRHKIGTMWCSSMDSTGCAVNTDFGNVENSETIIRHLEEGIFLKKCPLFFDTNTVNRVGHFILTCGDEATGFMEILLEAKQDNWDLLLGCKCRSSVVPCFGIMHPISNNSATLSIVSLDTGLNFWRPELKAKDVDRLKRNFAPDQVAQVLGGNKDLEQSLQNFFDRVLGDFVSTYKAELKSPRSSPAASPSNTPSEAGIGTTKSFVATENENACSASNFESCGSGNSKTDVVEKGVHDYFDRWKRLFAQCEGTPYVPSPEEEQLLQQLETQMTQRIAAASQNKEQRKNSAGSQKSTASMRTKVQKRRLKMVDADNVDSGFVDCGSNNSWSRKDSLSTAGTVVQIATLKNFPEKFSSFTNSQSQNATCESNSMDKKQRSQKAALERRKLWRKSKLESIQKRLENVKFASTSRAELEVEVSSFIKQRLESSGRPTDVFLSLRNALKEHCERETWLGNAEDYAMDFLRSTALKSSANLNIQLLQENCPQNSKLDAFKIQTMLHMFCTAEPEEPIQDLEVEYVDSVVQFLEYINIVGSRSHMQNFLNEDLMDCFLEERPKVLVLAYESLGQPIPMELETLSKERHAEDSEDGSGSPPFFTGGADATDFCCQSPSPTCSSGRNDSRMSGSCTEFGENSRSSSAVGCISLKRSRSSGFFNSKPKQIRLSSPRRASNASSSHGSYEFGKIRSSDFGKSSKSSSEFFAVRKNSTAATKFGAAEKSPWKIALRSSKLPVTHEPPPENDNSKCGNRNKQQQKVPTTPKAVKKHGHLKTSTVAETPTHRQMPRSEYIKRKVPKELQQRIIKESPAKLIKRQTPRTTKRIQSLSRRLSSASCASMPARVGCINGGSLVYDSARVGKNVKNSAVASSLLSPLRITRRSSEVFFSELASSPSFSSSAGPLRRLSLDSPGRAAAESENVSPWNTTGAYVAVDSRRLRSGKETASFPEECLPQTPGALNRGRLPNTEASPLLFSSMKKRSLRSSVTTPCAKPEALTSVADGRAAENPLIVARAARAAKRNLSSLLGVPEPKMQPITAQHSAKKATSSKSKSSNQQRMMQICVSSPAKSCNIQSPATATTKIDQSEKSSKQLLSLRDKKRIRTTRKTTQQQDDSCAAECLPSETAVPAVNSDANCNQTDVPSSSSFSSALPSFTAAELSTSNGTTEMFIHVKKEAVEVEEESNLFENMGYFPSCSPVICRAARLEPEAASSSNGIAAKVTSNARRRLVSNSNLNQSDQRSLLSACGLESECDSSSASEAEPSKAIRNLLPNLNSCSNVAVLGIGAKQHSPKHVSSFPTTDHDYLVKWSTEMQLCGIIGVSSSTKTSQTSFSSQPLKIDVDVASFLPVVDLSKENALSPAPGSSTSSFAGFLSPQVLPRKQRENGSLEKQKHTRNLNVLCSPTAKTAKSSIRTCLFGVRSASASEFFPLTMRQRNADAADIKASLPVSLMSPTRNSLSLISPTRSSVSSYRLRPSPISFRGRLLRDTTEVIELSSDSDTD